MKPFLPALVACPLLLHFAFSQAAPAKKPLTRGLSTGPQTQTDPVASAAEGQLIQSLRNRPTRSLSAAEREQIATVVKDKPKIDLEINFDYNSANISSRSLPSALIRCAASQMVSRSRVDGPRVAVTMQ